MIHLFHDWSQWGFKRRINYYWSKNDKYPTEVKEIWFRSCTFCGKPQYKKIMEK